MPLKRSHKLATALCAASSVSLVLYLATIELFRSYRNFELLGWLGVILTTVGLVWLVADRGKRQPVAFGMATGGLAALTIFAAPTTSAAIPLAALLFVGAFHPNPPIERGRWLAIVIGTWLISLGIANAFNRTWTGGGPLALVDHVSPQLELISLLHPSAVIEQSVLGPVLSSGPYRMTHPIYRLVVLASIFGPIAFGCGLFGARTRRATAAMLIPVFLIVSWGRWDPHLLFVATAGALAIVFMPADWNRARNTASSRFSERVVASLIIGTILLWPHVQRYLVAEYNLDGRSYYGQNDHGYLGWEPSVELRVRRELETITVDHDASEGLSNSVQRFAARAYYAGEFVARRPVASELKDLYPEEPELQISTRRFFLDPKNARIAVRGRDHSFVKRSDGSYFRSVYRFTKRFEVDEIRGASVPTP
jgi:hypothetical protein